MKCSMFRCSMLQCIDEDPFVNHFFITFTANLAGLVAEWLGSGLQNRVQRFESARDLTIISKALFNNYLNEASFC